MARLGAVDPTTATGKAKELLDKVQTAAGMTPNSMRTMAQSPAVLEGYLGFRQALGEGALPPKLREQLALTVADANRCVYCLSAHTAIGKKLGLSAEDLSSSRRATSVDPKVDAALKFARTVVERRGEVTDADVRAVKAAGHTEGEVAEILAHVALNVFTNYFNKVADVELDFPRVELTADAMAGTR